MSDLPDIPSAVRDLVEEFKKPRPMRRGSLSVRYVKCSKPGCPCSEDPEARHGPYYSLTRAVGGQTRSKFLTPEHAELVRQQVEVAKQFRKQLEAYWVACERWADAQIEARATSTGVAQKGGSKKSSRPKSSRKSRR